MRKSVLDNTSYKAKLIRIQRLISIRIAKAYRTVSNEALIVITGLTPINSDLSVTKWQSEWDQKQGCNYEIILPQNSR